MDERLKQWLDEQKAAEQTAKQAEKEQVLRTLGLFDPNKTTTRTIYQNTWKHEISEDEYNRLKRNGYNTYITTETVDGVIDVTDEEFELIKEYLKKNQDCQPKETVNSSPEKKEPEHIRLVNGEISAENHAIFVSQIIRAISIIFTALLVLCGIGGLIVFIELDMIWSGIGVLVSALILAIWNYILFISSWAILRMLANISINLFKIEKKTFLL